MNNIVIEKLRKSLLTRFILLIVTALILIPVLIPITLVVSWGGNYLLFPNQSISGHHYDSAAELEVLWHDEATALGNSSPAQINSRLSQLKEHYPDASLFWVDSTGTTLNKINYR
jgi:hypothetical protein